MFDDIPINIIWTNIWPCFLIFIAGFIFLILVSQISFIKHCFSKKLGLITAQVLKVMFAVSTAILWEISDVSQYFNKEDFPSGSYKLFLATCFCLSVWLTIELIFAIRNIRFENLSEQLQKYSNQITYYILRNKMINVIVGHKQSRLKCEKDTQNRTAKQITDALNPELQIELSLISLFNCIEGNIKTATGKSIDSVDYTLRIALHVPNQDQDKMECLVSWDGFHRDTEIRSVERNKSEFVISSGKSMVVHATKHGGLHIIHDTHQPQTEYENIFDFFKDEQKGRLKCIFVYGHMSQNKRYHPVIAGVLNVSDIFKDSMYDAFELEQDLKAFAERICFELDMLKFLEVS